MAKKTYNEKLNDNKEFPIIEEIEDARLVARHKGTRMLIAPPLFFDAVMRRIPAGQLTTAEAIRDHLAKQNGADFTCPLTGGIFINVVAHASEERKTDETPYWRTLSKDGTLNEKFPGGIEQQKFLLEAEGHTVVRRGRRVFVKDYEQKLFAL